MNVSLVNNSRGARPFGWGGPLSTWSTLTASPSNGKLKDSPFATFHAAVIGTAGTVTATINIQGTMDDLTGYGVTIPVVLTNASTTVTMPTTYSPFWTPASQSTGFDPLPPVTNTAVNGVIPGSFFDIPCDYNVMFAQGSNDTKRVALATTMVATGPGITVGTTISTVTATSLTLSAAPSGLATSPGVYWVNFANPYWAATVLGTITLSGTLYQTDGFATQSSWKYVRANVTAISGTNAAVSVIMGV